MSACFSALTSCLPTVVWQAPRTAAFVAYRLNATTFLINEPDDIYGESPYIYALMNYATNTIVLIDTGCGGHTRRPGISVKSLREFIETIPVDVNGKKPINEGGKMKYVIVITHCHYDHILGTEPFAADTPILSSGNDPSFLTPDQLQYSSLCAYLGIKLPKYTPTLVPHNYSIPQSPHVHVLHTPGHTPDEVAIWDESEGMLYVGDTLYDGMPIAFSMEGNLFDWFDTIDYLMSFVQTKTSQALASFANSPTSPLSEKSRLLSPGPVHWASRGVLIQCGHATAGIPALEMLEATKSFMRDVVEGREPLVGTHKRRTSTYLVYRQASGRFALDCPEKLILEARKGFELN